MKPSPEDIRRYWSNWQQEVDSATEYLAMADGETDPRLASIYRNLARTEEKHAGFWEAQLGRAGEPLRPRRPSWRSRILSFLAKRLGARAILSTIASKEAAGQDFYGTQPETQGTPMHAQEAWHARVLQAAAKTSAAPGPNRDRGFAGSLLGRLEGRHRAVGGNALRAAVLGANDGLCTNLSLITGMVGASVNPQGILVTGFAGLLAGACSMALGEWVSVTSSRELATREISSEADELELDPESEGEELRLIYESKGMSPAEADAFSRKILSDKTVALDTLTREELGIDPTDLGGSAWEAAAISFLLFSVGASLPLVPFLFSSSPRTLWISLAAGASGFFLIGLLISVFTGRPAIRSGLRQLILGLLAAGITFAAGRGFGAALAP